MPTSKYIFKSFPGGLITKITVKTSDHVYAASDDAFNGKLCGSDGKCCDFGWGTNRLKKGGKLELRGDDLKNCRTFDLDGEVKTVSLSKIGDDTWIGEYVEVESSRSNNKIQHVICPVQDWLEKNGKVTLQCQKSRSKFF